MAKDSGPSSRERRVRIPPGSQARIDYQLGHRPFKAGNPGQHRVRAPWPRGPTGWAPVYETGFMGVRVSPWLPLERQRAAWSHTPSAVGAAPTRATTTAFVGRAVHRVEVGMQRPLRTDRRPRWCPGEACRPNPERASSRTWSTGKTSARHAEGSRFNSCRSHHPGVAQMRRARALHARSAGVQVPPPGPCSRRGVWLSSPACHAGEHGFKSRRLRRVGACSSTD